MGQCQTATSQEETEIACRVRQLAAEQWGPRRLTLLIGRHQALHAAQERMLRFAQADGPVLITGETGTGKELFARALYLLGPRRHRPFLTVNCAQYTDGNLIASELFGHRRGSFTGAVADHRGVFEEADGGVVFLDEVGELTPSAQAMLLRVLSEGEVVPVGDTRVRHVNVRVVAATNRDLRGMVEAGRFREDLLFRLRCLHLPVPPLRARGDDWRLILGAVLRAMNEAARTDRRFSERSLSLLGDYAWPGNVRELRGLTEGAFHLAGADGRIDPDAFEEMLDRAALAALPAPAACTGPGPQGPCSLLDLLAAGAGSFWELVYDPFMDRELNRCQVRDLVAEGLRRSNWSYKRSLALLGIAPDEYLKFMDFLRHHRLKPER